MYEKHPKKCFSKAMRIWTLGACLAATIFISISCKYDFWAIKTSLRSSDNWEQTDYFGLWRTCRDERLGRTNTTTNQPMTIKCHYFGDNAHIGVYGTPTFIKLTRAFVILLAVVMGVGSIITALIMFTSDRPLLYWTLPFSFSGFVVGLIILGIFLGTMLNTDFYKGFDMAWAFYYFLIGWFFTISAFVTAALDK